MSCTIVSVCEAPRDVYAHQKDYREHAVRLVCSLRNNGGAASQWPVSLWYGEDVPPDETYRSVLTDMGCELRSGTCEALDHPIFNKITALQGSFDTDWVLWLDTDIYIRGDFSSIVSDVSTDVVLSPAPYLKHKWARPDEDDIQRKMYNLFDLKFPGPPVLTHIDGRYGNFYFSSGVILFRTDSGFAKAYYDVASRVLSSSIDRAKENFSQTCLGLAVLKGGFTWSTIPEKYHWVYSMRKSLPNTAAIIHHQGGKPTELTDDQWDVNL